MICVCPHSVHSSDPAEYQGPAHPGRFFHPPLFPECEGFQLPVTAVTEGNCMVCAGVCSPRAQETRSRHFISLSVLSFS